MSNERLNRSLRATFLGLAINVVLMAGKFVGGFLGHSHALVADAVESVADILSSIIVWRALVVAAEPPDREHPYGHGKAEPLAAAVAAIMLLLAAIGIAVKSAQEITTPHRPAVFTLIIVLGVTVIKEIMYRIISREADSVDNIAVKTDAWHHRSDAITSLAAAVGISLALIGGHNFEWADDAAAIIAAGIIAWNGWKLLRPAMDELMDTAPNTAMLAHIEKIAAAVPGVKGVEKCFARKMGYQYLVDMHLEVDPQITVAEGHHIAHSVKDKVRAEIPTISDVLVHIEPVSEP